MTIHLRSVLALAGSLICAFACGGLPPDEQAQVEATDEGGEALIAGDWTAPFEAKAVTSLTATEGNLSAGGAVDWAHLGKDSATTINGKAAVAIQNFRRIGSGPFARIPSGPLAFSWSDGSPTGSATDVRAHIRTCGLGNGFSFEVPARLRGRKVRVFAGAHNASAHVVAWRGSSGIRAGGMLASTSGSQFGYYDINFSSATDNAPLRIELTVVQAGATPVTLNSCVSLFAATLSDLPNSSGAATIAIEPPPRGFYKENDRVTVTVNASHPNNVRGVELFYDNRPVLPADLTAPYQFTATLKAGRGRFHAEVTTLLGTTFKSSPVDIDAFYVLENLSHEAIPDAGDWVTGALAAQTPANKIVKEAIAQLDIEHPYVYDLEIRLESPSGKSVLLSDENGGAGHDYRFTGFRDGLTPITQGAAPFEGFFAPEEGLSGMIGQALTGATPWRLKVRDRYASDVGTVKVRYLYVRAE